MLFREFLEFAPDWVEFPAVRFKLSFLFLFIFFFGC